MNRTHLDIVFVALLGMALCTTACSRAQAAQEDKHDDHAGHDHSGHVHADGTPATQAEWCSLAGVPAAQCTQVLAEYKAKGDWCDQHQLPKSRCIKCNPTLSLKQPAKAN